jgi:hypothetical protein
MNSRRTPTSAVTRTLIHGPHPTPLLHGATPTKITLFHIKHTHTHTHSLSLSLSLSLLSLFSLHSTWSNLCRNKNSRRHTYRAFSSSLTSIQPRLQQQQGWRHGQTVCPELPLSVCLSLYLHTKNLKCNNTNKDAAVPSGYFWVSDPGSLSSSAWASRENLDANLVDATAAAATTTQILLILLMLLQQIEWWCNGAYKFIEHFI